ncbi:Uncharacterized 2Fe-2 and 4Fe-4S clusters-containing protein, contains DUF4445 domain [Desulfatibacillum alkenivorans DSM 16219]|jgi:uncharacterized 2Fe-2S/4Fe-4S cluster protein (DUF4445 family)|uniref:Uncharacterized 2Fe-2 and 4Fe-4S clusters-containing protein, contains DUF4445 domain n=1 Tax=Desulfatibacillum alkenivorans DSM 16219 TaxID=1121393 RepID=A0A1M6XPX0_9BACT|nr:ASKHA domain-containing protein [Desulfatibacillum alkenivorans]SHL07845.1 Uncharacterized 2Fe-2 and 4Fe-4S clusters-containing protein, contains DUF4445 domain [Desulfatibacillum alkenivorans DSM 16219]
MVNYKTVTLLPSGEKIRVKPGSVLLDALKDGCPIRADCGGKGICGKCKIILDDPERSSPVGLEKDFLAENRIDAGWRLACQIQVHTDMKIRLPENSLDQGQAQGKSIPRGPYTVNQDLHAGPLGLAVDIGTTNVAAYLCDLQKGVILASASSVNPQRRFGQDVVSRIQAASDPAGLEELKFIIIDAIHCLADECIVNAGQSQKQLSRRNIGSLAVVGNTAMQHIFAGIDPTPLALSPYEPENHAAMDRSARFFGLALSETCRAYIAPVISGFAGGDILACALADGLMERRETTLIVDVGTNGELILKSGENVYAASCATGPAFEGALISCGMRAVEGAVSACSFDAARNRFAFKTMGNDSPPLGICGSGVIEAVHALREAGFVEASGRLIPQGGDWPDRVSLLNGRRRSGDVDVYITQKDVRQVQLAKAAVATGIICLMEKAGVKQVDRTILTGAFGHAFNWRKAAEIGMFPELSALGRVETRPNLAGQGAVMILLDKTQQAAIQKIQESANYIHLADDAEFTQRFVSQTLFPYNGK